ncbi:MAG: hypothetical protein U0414_31440 [Polyangiaceae bacterium]
MSRWTMLAACARSRPRAASLTMRATSCGGRERLRTSRSNRLSPRSSSMTMYGMPSLVRPWSNVRTTCGLSIRAASFASRLKRSTTMGSSVFASSAEMNFTATSRSSPAWRADQTLPMPPCPSSRTSSKVGVIFWPGTKPIARVGMLLLPPERALSEDDAWRTLSP